MSSTDWTERNWPRCCALPRTGRKLLLALREGSELDLGANVGPAALPAPDKPQGTWLRVQVEAEPDKYLLGNAPETEIELTDELARAVKSVPGTKVLVVTAESTPYVRLRQALETVQAAGVATIRLAQSIDDP